MFQPPSELLSLGRVCVLLAVTPAKLERLKRLTGVSAFILIDGIPYYDAAAVETLRDGLGLLAGPRCRMPGDD